MTPALAGTAASRPAASAIPMASAATCCVPPDTQLTLLRSMLSFPRGLPLPGLAAGRYTRSTDRMRGSPESPQAFPRNPRSP